MAYDPNDPKDKATVQALIDAALAEQTEAHEAAIEGLVANRDKLKADLRKARAGETSGDNSAEVEKLEAQLTEANNKLKQATKDLTKAQTQLETVTGERDSLNTDLTTNLVQNGLTAELTKAKVDPKFMSAVSSLLAPKVTIETADGQRRAVADGKPLGEFVTAWSQSDEGKNYVSAAGNSGGGAGGSQGGQGATGKTWTRDQYDAADAGSRQTFFAEGGKIASGG